MTLVADSRTVAGPRAGSGRRMWALYKRHAYELRHSVPGFVDMYHDKYELTRLAHEHLRSNDYQYPNGMKAPPQVIEFIEAEAAGKLVPPPGGTHAQIPSQPGPSAQPPAGTQPTVPFPGDART